MRHGKLSCSRRVRSRVTLCLTLIDSQWTIQGNPKMSSIRNAPSVGTHLLTSPTWARSRAFLAKIAKQAVKREHRCSAETLSPSIDRCRCTNSVSKLLPMLAASYDIQTNSMLSSSLKMQKSFRAEMLVVMKYVLLHHAMLEHQCAMLWLPQRFAKPSLLSEENLTCPS